MKIADIFRKFRNGKMRKTDLAVLRVSMLVAALDGDVCKQEIEEFQSLAKECEGYSEEEARKAFSETLRSAGFLMLYARVERMPEVLNAFLEEADRILPAIVDFGPDKMKNTIAVWTAMANADGNMSEVERQAIDCLAKTLAARNLTQTQASVAGVAIPR